MGRIILPNRIKGQPQKAVNLAAGYKDSAVFFSLLNDGVAARDIIKGNNLATAGGASPPVPSVRSWGRTLTFDSASMGLVSPSNIAALPLVTVIAWARPAAVNTGYRRIAETDYASNFYLGSNTSGGQYAFITNNGALEGCIGGQQVAGRLDFVAGTYDGANRNLYVNGLPVASVVGTAPSFPQVLYVGKGAQGPLGYWNGDINYVGVFNRVFPASEIWQLYQDFNRIFEQPKRVLVFGTGSVGGATYNQSVSGSLTASGSLLKLTSKSFGGSSTPAGELSRLISKYPSGSITSTGSIVKKTSSSLAGSSTVTGNLNKLTTHSFAGSITPSGTLATMILFTCAIAGSLTASGALQKMTLKALAGASTLSGALTKLTSKNLSASITMSGLLNKLTKKAFAGSVTATGALIESYQVLKSLAGSIKPTGVVTGLYIAFVLGVLKLLALMGVGQ